jgi:hypothetical protein
VKSKIFSGNIYSIKIKYVFLRDSSVCPRWIFIFINNQAQINSALGITFFHLTSSVFSHCVAGRGIVYFRREGEGEGEGEEEGGRGWIHSDSMPSIAKRVIFFTYSCPMTVN